jgi:putative ABC transport system permease protein
MLLQDLRYAVRTLTKKPGFACVTVLTLALGIGANAAIFSAVQAVLLRPMPFPQPERLVSVFSTSIKQPDLPGGTVSPPDFVDWRAQSRSFVELAAMDGGSSAWSGTGPAEQVPSASVTGGFFTVLGVPAVHGRTLTKEDDPTNAPNVVVISHRLWTRRFAGDPGVLGRPMTLDGSDYRIAGIMPEGFAYPLQTELWVPLRFSADTLATQRGAQYLDVIGRLRDGVTLEAARAEMHAVAQRQQREFPNTNDTKAISIHGLRDALVGEMRRPMLVLLGAVGFVLLIVCVNVANLVLTRTLGRTRELAIRAALGAGQRRLINGLLVESVVLAVLGGVAGLLMAQGAASLIASLDTNLGIPLLDQTRVDGVVLAFAAGVSLLAAVLFGTLPAWHTSRRLDVSRRIREDSSTVTGDRERQRLRGGLIIVETSLAVVLLVGAGLLMRSFLEMASVDLGFDSTRVQTFNMTMPGTKYPTPASRARFVEELLARIGSHPDVESSGAIFGLPLSDFRYSISTSTLDGRQLPNDEQNAKTLLIRVASHGYFRTLGIPIIRGRDFGTSDRLGTTPVVIVNETAARRLWPGEDALGHHLAIGSRMSQGGDRAGGTVVGIARDLHDFGPVAQVRPTLYLVHAQVPMNFITVVAKARRDPQLLVEPMRAALADLDSDIPMYRVRTMEQFVSQAVAQPRLYMLLLGLFAGAAVLLAAIGIYGVLAHAVSQRTREIGIRLALGAARAQVVRMVVVHAGRLALSGLTLGLVLAALASRLLESLLFGVPPVDAVTYGSVAVGLLGIALLAAWLPARRASRISPLKALRYE